MNFSTDLYLYAFFSEFGKLLLVQTLDILLERRLSSIASFQGYVQGQFGYVNYLGYIYKGRLFIM